eukprot:SAG31_NODE_30047_length_386_cov_0.717770_1_plen_97_part_01
MVRVYLDVLSLPCLSFFERRRRVSHTSFCGAEYINKNLLAVEEQIRIQANHQAAQLRQVYGGATAKLHIKPSRNTSDKTKTFEGDVRSENNEISNPS